MVKIDGQTFIVSGGASGLGFGAVQEIVAAGGSVAIIDRDASAEQKVVNELGADKCLFHETDVGSSESIAKAVSNIVEWIGKTGRPLGGIVTAAGIGIPTMAISEDGEPLNMEHWDTVFRVNVRGSIALATQLLPHWTQAAKATPDADHGAIIFISSITAFEGSHMMAAYSSSKAALMGAVLPLARDLSPHGIRVVAISPGAFQTPLYERLPEPIKADQIRSIAFPKRPGNPRQHFAPLVKHILENEYINGTTLRIDGSMRTPWP
ncbi:hypothetical protein PV10_05185 [Exophiala mesophila]|uniref:3-hydroxyacyl-CoA dehydrogenase type-2 n=1 Tax=Exophiala mesophila TaxID=212818 RepID=A0A0D1ZHE9_EXOME|nr:uncharacterized protein PV10_05185 [Exophiala mesophila]KIV94022.1 hypothetical protein PV10_05185 [Exophiala mesophila]